MTTTELKQYIEKVLGNSIRCLLPSYWWKRLFNQVADRIDTAEQYAEELVDASKMPIVESEEELNKLDLEDGNLASVLWQETKERSFRELYQASILEALGGNFSRCTVVEDIITRVPSLDGSVALIFGTADGSRAFTLVVVGASMTVETHDDKELSLYKYGEYVQEGHDYLREELSSFQYVFAMAMDYTSTNVEDMLKVNYDLIDPFLTCVATLPTSNVYIKGNTWEKLAKAGESGGSSGGDITVDSSLSTTSTNPVQNKVVTEAIQELQSLPFSGGVLITDDTMAMTYLRAMFDTPKENANIAGYILYEEHNDSGGVVRYSLGVVDSVDINENTDTASLEYNIHGKRYRNIYNSASGALVETVELSSGGLPIYLCIDYGVGILSPPDREREVNKVAYNALQKEGSSALPYCIMSLYNNGEKIGEVSMGIEHYSTGTNLYFYTSDWDNGNTFDLLKYRLHEDGSVTYEGLVQADSEMSDTSTNPVQNKVIKAYVDEVTSNVAITIVQDIVDSELVTAAALNDLNDRIKKLEEQLNNAES